MDVSQSPDAAWQEIEELVSRIDKLSKTAIPFADFAQEVVDQAVRSLEATGGALWMQNGEGRVRPIYHSNLCSGAETPERWLALHQRHAEAAIREGKAGTVGANAGPDIHGGLPAGATETWLFFTPIDVDDRVAGTLELAHATLVSPLAQRGNLQLMGVLCEYVSRFLTRRQLDTYREIRQTWQQFREFAREIHRGIDLRETSFRIVNAGQHFSGCERLSLLTTDRQRCRLQAVSGLDTIQGRSQAVKMMEDLAWAVAKSGETLNFQGAGRDLPPQIEEPLERHRDVSHARSLIAIPLLPTASEEANGLESRPIGVILGEWFEDLPERAVLDRMELLAEQSGSALANAMTFDRLPAVVRRVISRPRAGLFQLSTVAVSSLVLILLVVLLLLLRTEFRVTVEGELQPRERREVFSPEDAEVIELRVEHDVPVVAGQTLLQLRSPKLELDLQRVRGELDTVREQLWAVESVRLQASPDGEKSPVLLAAEVEQLRQRLASHQKQLALLQEQMDQLNIKSPIKGRVLTWDLEKLLQDRPVRRGQVLVSVGDTQGEWIAELNVPDDRIGYILRAQRQREDALPVSLQLAMRRGKTFQGMVEQVASRTELSDDGDAEVAVTVRLDDAVLSEARPGTTITARIHCGRCSIAYAWFHDLIELGRQWLNFF